MFLQPFLHEKSCQVLPTPVHQLRIQIDMHGCPAKLRIVDLRVSGSQRFIYLRRVPSNLHHSKSPTQLFVGWGSGGSGGGAEQAVCIHILGPPYCFPIHVCAQGIQHLCTVRCRHFRCVWIAQLLQLGRRKAMQRWTFGDCGQALDVCCLQNAMTSSEERTSAEAEGYRIERALMDCVAPP